MSSIYYAIWNRLHGALRKECKGYSLMKARSDFPFANNRLRQCILYYFATAPKAFLFSNIVRAQRKNALLDIYTCLCDLYTSPASEALFDFGGVLLPKMNHNNERVIFVKELLDFFIYSLDEDTTFCDAVSCEGPYELNEVRIEKGDIVVDCGANVGVFSAMASQREAHVFAFEPNPKVVSEYLSITAEYNKNIKICEYALSAREEILAFSQTVDNFAGGQIDFSSKHRNGEVCSNVKAITLDSFVMNNSIEKVDFIKADIEGAERHLLIGAREVIKNYAPKIAICTYHLPDDPKVLRELILDANPSYTIYEQFMKMYAHVPK